MAMLMVIAAVIVNIFLLENNYKKTRYVFSVLLQAKRGGTDAERLQKFFDLVMSEKTRD